MTVLSDGEIYDAMERGLFGIRPWVPDSIQPASIDLHVQEIADGFVIPPHSRRLGCTVEVVTLSDRLTGQINPRSTFARRGGDTKGWVDPGFTGQLVLEIDNHGDEPLEIEPGSSICQLVLWRLGRPAMRPYGHPDRKSRYQGQVGIVPARETRP